MKSLKIAILLALLLPLSSNALTTPSSPSYKSGFSSQKSSTAKGAPKNKSFGSFAARPPAGAPASPPATAPKSAFGSFGNAPAASAPPPSRSTSALSKDLDQSSANANALKTLDARNAAANAPPPLNNPVPGQQPQQYGQQQPYQQPYRQPQPIIVQQPNSGFGNMFMGFMLGRALSGNHHDTDYRNSNGTVSQQSGAVVEAPQAGPEASFGMSVLRIFLWLVILSCIAWIIYFGVKYLRRNKASNAPNYSFKRD
ncbi:MAG TPA: hypothetical protein VGP06_14850 [Janthinobacterium sp.]|nr:hypothetical protein [Janthinobacterium sp.]